MSGFNEIIGQDQLKEHFNIALSQNRVSHAYILQGERNSGKEFCAELFVRGLQCEGEGERPCGICRSCLQSIHHNHPDIIHITHEKPNSIGVEDVRKQINQDMGIKPYQGPYKIYLIREGELLTPQAQNALLKTLEEPPEYGVIIIMTSQEEKLLTTIQSRCVTLHMRPVKDESVMKFLMEELQIPDYKARICTAFARGNLGKAKHLAISEEFDHLKEEAVNLLKYVHDMDISDIVFAIKKIQEYKFDIIDYLDLLTIWYRDALLFKATNDVNYLIFKEEIQYIRKVADRCSYRGIEAIIEAFFKAKSRLNANVNFDLTMELLLITIKEDGGL